MYGNKKTDALALEKIMLEQGFSTIESLSIKTDINCEMLNQIMQGEIQPSTEIMDKLIETLNIPLMEAGSIFFSEPK